MGGARCSFIESVKQALARTWCVVLDALEGEAALGRGVRRIDQDRRAGQARVRPHISAHEIIRSIFGRATGSKQGRRGGRRERKVPKGRGMVVAEGMVALVEVRRLRMEGARVAEVVEEGAAARDFDFSYFIN